LHFFLLVLNCKSIKMDPQSLILVHHQTCNERLHYFWLVYENVHTWLGIRFLAPMFSPGMQCILGTMLVLTLLLVFASENRQWCFLDVDIDGGNKLWSVLYFNPVFLHMFLCSSPYHRIVRNCLVYMSIYSNSLKLFHSQKNSLPVTDHFPMGLFRSVVLGEWNTTMFFSIVHIPLPMACPEKASGHWMCYVMFSLLWKYFPSDSCSSCISDTAQQCHFLVQSACVDVLLVDRFRHPWWNNYFSLQFCMLILVWTSLDNKNSTKVWRIWCT
jgi:hypothetical protein